MWKIKPFCFESDSNGLHLTYYFGFRQKFVCVGVSFLNNSHCQEIRLSPNSTEKLAMQRNKKLASFRNANVNSDNMWSSGVYTLA